MDLTALTDDTFAAFLEKNPLALICFMASWNGTFRMLRPTLVDLAASHNIPIGVATIDIDQSPKMTTQYTIRSLPTCLLFKQGQVIAQQVGVLSLENLKELIASKINLHLDASS